MRRLLVFIQLLLVMSLSAGCSTTVPRTMALSTVTYRSDQRLSTLSSAVTLSFRSPEKHMSGRGMMAFQQPDRMRLVLLSPFGTTIMEVLVDGTRLTMAYPGSGVAYQGQINQLPASTGQKGWGLLQWVLTSDPPAGAPANGTIVHARERGGNETITLENGLVVEKNLVTGERVRYQQYQQVQGVWLAMNLLMESADGERITLHLEDPEVNADLGAQAFTLRLDGLKLLPLLELKGP